MKLSALSLHVFPPLPTKSATAFTPSSTATMEVDMRMSPPPTFRPVAFNTVKRPRSPGSPTQERHPKRPSLAPIASEGQHIHHASTEPDRPTDGRTSQDDWVRQARELSIASPLSVTVGFLSDLHAGPTAAVAQSLDEHMAVDYEESQVLRVHVHPGSSRPWVTRTHLPSIHITTTPASHSGIPDELYVESPAPFSVLTEPPTSSISSTSMTQTTPGAPCPDIFLFPATPLDTPSHHHQFTTDYAQHAGENVPGPHVRMQDQCFSPSSLTRGQDRIDGSPRPSRAPDIPASSGRKHRVTMGPRADCIKCRTGVRGHWMHFD